VTSCARVSRFTGLLFCAAGCFAQFGAPPKNLLLVRQQIKFGKEGVRHQLELSTKQRYDRYNVPVYWLEMESLTGQPEVVFFDPFDSFEALEKASAVLRETNTKHPELTRFQSGINELLASERTVIAERRDDLGYRQKGIDISRSRLLRIAIVSVQPGHERDFTEMAKSVSAAQEKANAPIGWIVYEVKDGMPTPSFLAFMMLRSLAEANSEISFASAYASVESNIYIMNPELSHLSRDFAAGDPEFWTPKVAHPAATATTRSRR
jgi:hypothetical protein